MTSSTTTLKVPDLLLQALRTRAVKLGYPSFNSYIIGLGCYDLLCQGDHHTTTAIARAKGHVRDKIYAWLLRLAERGTGERGVLLNHIVERVTQRHQTSLQAALDLAEEDENGWTNWSI